MTGPPVVEPGAGSRGPRLREEPEDFVVDELPLYDPSGEGDHTFVHVEKRLRTTEEVARDLARAAGVAPRDVGYAGRKDRVAVTSQWYSVPRLDPAVANELTLPGVRVLAAERHGHKLRTGQLRGNRFVIRVRGVSAALRERAEERAAEIVREGFPNRFGPQRFGRDGGNVERARRLLAGASVGRDRRQARFWMSALQAAVFNAVLASRPLAIGTLERGDVAVRHESGGLFVVEDLAAEQLRAQSFEISPTGPIFGTKVLLPEGEPAQRESALLSEWGVPQGEDLRPPRGLRLRGARRPLRVRAEALEVRVEQELVELRFCLPAGCYASVVVEELGLSAEQPHTSM